MAASRALPGVEEVLDGAAAARRFELPLDLEGDFVVLGDAGTVDRRHPRRARSVGPRRPSPALARRARRAEGAVHGVAQAARRLGAGAAGARPCATSTFSMPCSTASSCRSVRSANGAPPHRSRRPRHGGDAARQEPARSRRPGRGRPCHEPERGAPRRRSPPAFPFPTTDSFAAILEDRSIDAVAVLTPPNTHLEIATELARAGKHILLEKPLEVSTARAEQLVAACATRA